MLEESIVIVCCLILGLTIVFASGNDGIGGYNIDSDPVAACQKANPYWPASSPYVTSVGATQLTDKYLPVCGKTFSVRRLANINYNFTIV